MVISHVERDFNYLQSSQIDAQRARHLLLLPLALLPTSRSEQQTGTAISPRPELSGAGSCVPSTAPCPAEPAASPLPAGTPATRVPPAQQSELTSSAVGNHLPCSLIVVFSKPFSPGCLLLLQHQQH